MFILGGLYFHKLLPFPFIRKFLAFSVVHSLSLNFSFPVLPPHSNILYICWHTHILRAHSPSHCPPAIETLLTLASPCFIYFPLIYHTKSAKNLEHLLTDYTISLPAPTLIPTSPCTLLSPSQLLLHTTHTTLTLSWYISRLSLQTLPTLQLYTMSYSCSSTTFPFFLSCYLYWKYCIKCNTLPHLHPIHSLTH